jgi:cob(I)alamin adenosyltransferase
MENTIFDVQFDLQTPEHMTATEIDLVVKDIVKFIEENAHMLDDEVTLDRFLNHCNERKYYMPLVHQVTTQIFEAMYGKEMLAEMAEHGYAKKPTVN